MAAIRQPVTVWASVALDDVGIVLHALGVEGIGWFGGGFLFKSSFILHCD
jgi:hypothetical protein